MKKNMNNLNSLFNAMRYGKYAGFYGADGKGYIGIINSIMREDGSGKNWIVSVTYNIKYAASGAVTENVFVHAN